MELKKLIQDAHNNSIDKGWWDEGKQQSFSSFIANVHAEVSEAFEEYKNRRALNQIYCECNDIDCIYNSSIQCYTTTNNCSRGKPCGIPIELADIIIRIADYCGYHKIDLEKAIQMKMEYNKTRSYRHGNKII